MTVVIVQGRLKVITLAPRLTVAFAGLADRAGVTIRETRGAYLAHGFQAAVEVLRESSSDGEVDFVVCFHGEATQVLRLRNGVGLDVPDFCTLGHANAFEPTIAKVRSDTDARPLSHGYLRDKFIDKLLKNGDDLGDQVGGWPFAVHATSTGHRYLRLSAFHIYEFPQMQAGREVHQPIEQLYTGRGHYEFSIIPLMS